MYLWNFKKSFLTFFSFFLAPTRLIRLNIWSPVNGTIWEGLGGVALLEEVCFWGQALRFEKPTPFPVKFLCLLLIDGYMSYQLLFQCPACLLAAMLPARMVMDSLSEATSSK